MKRIAITLALLLTCICVGCQNGPSCGGPCGLLGGGSCGDGSCYAVGPQGEHSGIVGGLVGGRKHRGPQSHTGAIAGPAMGPPSPTYGYPYYTTRGPRDFLAKNPPNIGR